MQLMVQTQSDHFNTGILEEAKAADILFRVTRSLSNTLTVRLTSYEWNARMSITFRCYLVSVLNGSFYLGNLFELMRRCLDLPYDQMVMPSLPQSWLALAEITCNSFGKLSRIYLLSNCIDCLPMISAVHSSAKLLSFVSSSTQSSSSSQQPSAILIDASQSYSLSSSNSGLSSPRAATESCIPASLAASRFDHNSSRLLSNLLETAGLSHYSSTLSLHNAYIVFFVIVVNELDLILG